MLFIASQKFVLTTSTEYDIITVLYDYRKIFRAADNKSSKIITIFDGIVFKRKPRSVRDPRYYLLNKDYSGGGFMLNPKGLLRYRSSYTDKEICEYIALAGMRLYSNYVVTGETRLPCISSPVSTEKLKANRLLTVKDNKVLFLFEEVLKENK